MRPSLEDIGDIKVESQDDDPYMNKKRGQKKNSEQPRQKQLKQKAGS